MKGGVHKGEIVDRRKDIGALLGINEESIKPKEGSFEKASRTICPGWPLKFGRYEWGRWGNLWSARRSRGRKIGGRCKNGRWSDTFSLKLAFFWALAAPLWLPSEEFLAKPLGGPSVEKYNIFRTATYRRKIFLCSMLLRWQRRFRQSALQSVFHDPQWTNWMISVGQKLTIKQITNLTDAVGGKSR